jgi:hypothetical protein
LQQHAQKYERQVCKAKGGPHVVFSADCACDFITVSWLVPFLSGANSRTRLANLLVRIFYDDREGADDRRPSPSAHPSKRGSKHASATLWLLERTDKILFLILVFNSTLSNALANALTTASTI